MKVDAGVFNGIVRMFEERRPGIDEVEAVYSDHGGLSRDVTTRLLRHLGASFGKPRTRDVLDVQTDSGVSTLRVSVEGEAAIRASLGEGKWDTPASTVIRKARLRTVSLQDYRMRVNMKEEVPVSDRDRTLAAMGALPGKTFRLKRRFSFETEDGFSVDVTGVRQLSSGAAVPRHERMLLMPETYELEVEYVGVDGVGRHTGGAAAAARVVAKKGKKAAKADAGDDAAAVAAKAAKGEAAAAAAAAAKVDGRALAMALIRHFNVLLKVVDDTDYLMTPGEKEGVLEEYVSLTWGGARGPLPTDPRARSRLFVGPMPVTLELRNLLPPGELTGGVSVLQGYTVTEKADGERRLLYVASDGRAYTIDNRLAVRRVGVTCKTLRRCLLDGEHVPRYARPKAEAVSAYMAFDAFYVDGQDVRGLPLVPGRIEAIARVVKDAVMPEDFLLAAKKYEHGGDMLQLACRMLAKRDAGNFPYEIDGLVFTPAHLAVGAMEPGQPLKIGGGGRWSATLKWKPPYQNTIDFLVRLRPEDELVVKDGVPHRVADLLVGYDQAKNDAVTALDYLSGEAESRQHQRARGQQYIEKLFTVPGADEQLHVCHLPRRPDGTLRCENNDEIMDGLIVEFSRDTVHDAWLPKRHRHDKTDLFISGGVVTANSYQSALNIWHTILAPVTEDILCGKTPVPAEAAAMDGVYYANDLAPDQGDTQAMRKFHNHWVKKEALLARFKGRTRSLFDFGCGRAGDLFKWMDMGVSRVVGVDKYAENLTNPDPNLGAYARILKEKRKAGNQSLMPRVALVPMDATHVIGPAYIASMDDSQGDRTVANVLWGLVPPAAVANPKLRAYHRFALGGFDLATCMFAVHYFFGDAEHLRNFAKNVAAVLRPGGCFVGVCMDGGLVDKALSEARADSIEGRGQTKDAVIWRVTRNYAGKLGKSADPWDEIGKEVNVFMESIGHELPEYLVDFRLLVAAMAEVGMEPLDAGETAALGLKESTGFFEELYRDMVARGDRKVPAVQRAIGMSPDEKRYSFLNRWFVFTKRTAGKRPTTTTPSPSPARGPDPPSFVRVLKTGG
jgi:SAM-dependent methyltransferase